MLNRQNETAQGWNRRPQSLWCGGMEKYATRLKELACDEYSEYADIVDDSAERSAPSAAFAKFPNDVARDLRVTPDLLVLLAYRSTIADRRSPFGLSERALTKRPIVRPQTGMGKNNIREAVALALKLGYMTRRQLPRQGNGTWGRAVDQLALPKCGETGLAGRHVKRAWFDGSLSRDVMAAFIYIRAGTGKGPSIFAGELQSRFGWSRPKAAKVLRELIARKLVGRANSRSDQGRMLGVTYTPTPASSWSIWSTVKKPGTGSQGDGKPGHLRSNPPHGLSTREPSSRTLRGSYAAPDWAAATLTRDDMRREALSSPRLLKFEMENVPVLEGMLNAADAALAAVESVRPDSDLEAALRDATQGRVHPEILSAAGLFSVRMLAAMVLASADTNEDCSAAGALGQVLEAITERIGNRDGVWLNALSVIGQRIVGSLRRGYSSDVFRPQSATGHAPSPANACRKAKKAPPALAATIAELKRADRARVLSAAVLKDHAGLARLLARDANAVEVIRSKLIGAMIDGPPVASIRSWSYFDGAIKDERAANELAQLGLSPGDCFGAHKRNGARPCLD